MPRRAPGKSAFTRYRKTALVVLAVLVAAGGYVWLLKYKNQAVAEHFDHLQHKDARAYLSHVRLTRGFHTYVAEYAKLRRYRRWHQDAPPFLVGRWALFDAPKRVSENYFPEECLDAVEIEDGRIKRMKHGTQTYSARYRIDGNRVVAELNGQRILPIVLASYGTALHHIVVTLPGDGRQRYGYLCK